MCNFPCCFLWLSSLPICCAPSKRVWLHLFYNCLLVSGRLQLGLFRFLQLGSQPLLSRVYSSPLTILVGFCWTCCIFSVPLTLDSSKLDIALQIRSQKHCAQGKDPLPWPMVQLIQPRMLLVCFIARALCLLLFSLLSPRTPRVFSSKIHLQAVGIHLGLLPGNVLHPFPWILGPFRLSQFGVPKMK